MSNGRVCCLLGICCARAAQVEYIEKGLAADGVPAEAAAKSAEWFADKIAAIGDLEAAVVKMKREQKGKAPEGG